MMGDSETKATAASSSLFPELGAKEQTCEEHGPYITKGRLLGKREVWTICTACSAQQEALREAESAAQAAAQRARDRSDALDRACIPQRFRDRSFDNFVADTADKVRALDRVRQFADAFPNHLKNGTGLILAGLPGTGKTHLATAVMLQLLSPTCRVQYISCMGLIRSIRETWRSDSERSEREVLRKLGFEVDLLVIDEVGVQYGTAGEQTILFEILDRRYAEMRPTILLTNQDKAGFKEHVGERIADRLTQTQVWIPFDWPSYRRQAREQGAMA